MLSVDAFCLTSMIGDSARLDRLRQRRHRHPEVDLENLPELQLDVLDARRLKPVERRGRPVHPGRQRRKPIDPVRIRDRRRHADESGTPRFDRRAGQHRPGRVFDDPLDRSPCLLCTRRRAQRPNASTNTPTRQADRLMSPLRSCRVQQENRTDAGRLRGGFYSSTREWSTARKTVTNLQRCATDGQKWPAPGAAGRCASELREQPRRSAGRRARARVGESEGRRPSDETVSLRRGDRSPERRAAAADCGAGRRALLTADQRADAAPAPAVDPMITALFATERFARTGRSSRYTT